MIAQNTIILLTGKPRTGKSTAIQWIMRRLGPERCGGFYTEEIRGEHDREGFRCVDVSGESRVIASVYSASPLRIGRYGVDVEAFEALALPAIRASLSAKQVTVIDEIGFMQMLSVPFQALMEEIVRSPQAAIILGTVCLDSHPAIDRVKAAAGGKLFTLTTDNRDTMREEVFKAILATGGP